MKFTSKFFDGFITYDTDAKPAHFAVSREDQFHPAGLFIVVCNEFFVANAAGNSSPQCRPQLLNRIGVKQVAVFEFCEIDQIIVFD